MATENIAAQLLSDLKRDFGLTDAQAAGVVGNLMHESGGFQSLQEQNPGSGRGGFGYAQWTGARRNAFENYAAQNGLDPKSYEANYGYLKHELNTDPYERRQFDTVKQAKTAAEAAKLVSDNFLRPGTPNIAARQNYANQALGYASSPVPPMDVSNIVASQLSVTPPRLPPVPASVEERITARNTNPPNSLLQEALNAEAARRATAINNQVTPASVEERVTARNRVPLPSVFNGDPMTPAQGSVVASTPSAPPSLFNGDPMTPAGGQVVASIPSRSIPPVSSAPISFAGQERAARFNGDPLTPSGGPVIASFSTGQAPSTRTVPTTRVGNSGANINQARNEQAIQRQVAPPIGRIAAPSIPQSFAGQDRLTPRALPNQAQLTAGTGFRVPQAAQFQTGVPVPDRLTAGVFPVDPSTVPQLPTIAAPRVATQLAVTPPVTAPRPFSRPAIAPTVARQAPVPFTRPSPAVQSPMSPLRVVVQGANPIRPTAPVPQQRPAQQAAPPSLFITDPIRFGMQATSQSGDTSVGSQADAAAARASGEGGRTRRY